ncbi:hypothetical protein SAMN05421842_12628 [Clostridium uliginosum]|uniref:Uncharacterized protein n=1 Tax=Clostridium uliginosum TaxID=119641 RepID=A0A1I1QPK1_9CLOT|nr:hypothetical protein SAMN05421842_12628 [Clostridium uliginosum]
MHSLGTYIYIGVAYNRMNLDRYIECYDMEYCDEW